MKLLFPEYALECITTIERHGFEAWFVGGCVRDAMLSRPFYDIDVTTNALPEDIIEIFDKTHPTGIKHGTITVVIHGHTIEVTTFRSESGYSDKRHPEKIVFEKDIAGDLSRRDFTINALAYNPKKGLLDLFSGVNDLNNKTIKTVGNPYERFDEDALRILRAFRFSSTLGFSIQDETLKAAISSREGLLELSGERIFAELKKLSQGRQPEAIGVLSELSAFYEFGIGRPRFELMSVSGVDEEYKTAMLIFLHEHNIKALQNKLHVDSKTLKHIKALCDFESLSPPTSKQQLKEILSQFFDLKDLFFNYCFIKNGAEYRTRVLKIYNEICDNGEPYLIQHLKINGNDLLELGVQPSLIGAKLNLLLNLIISDPSLNDKSILSDLVKKI